MSTTELDRKNRGRPRSFDREAALDRAVAVFHRKGYAATSLTELTQAMGINPPSLYAAFGSKEALFREAVGRYRMTLGRYIEHTLADAPSAVDGITHLLRATAAALTHPDHPRGCLCVLGDQGCHDEELRRFMAEMRAETIRVVADRLARGQRDGDVPASASLERLSRFVGAVIAGMSLQARDGADRTALDAIVEMAVIGVGAALAQA
jgi:AcrR family transcriptional regulator